MRDLSICFALFLGWQPLLGQVAFLRKDILVADRPSIVVVGDFNGDSRPDLAVNSFSGLSIFLNTGGGSFARPITTPAPMHPMFGPEPSQYTVAADFNRDGRLDLAGIVEPRTAHLLLGRGDGTFEPREVGPAAQVADTGDFNGDRIPDLVTVEVDRASGQQSSVILLGNGEGYFQRGARIERSGLRVADFNRDGLSDLAVSLPQGGLAVLLSRGDGTLRPPVETPDTGFFGIAADFNRDGVPDIVTGTEVLLGKGDGTFQSIRYIPSRRGFPNPFAAADFDGDGHVDLAGWLSHEGGEGNYITVFRGKSDGTLSLPAEYAAGWQATGQGVADLDGDGRPDLISANFRSNSLTLLLPKPQGPSLNRAVSAASGTAIVAPESLATLYIVTGVMAAQNAAAPYSLQLGGIRLEVRDSAGATHAAPLAFVSPTQINFQVPARTAAGEAVLVITGDRGSSTAGGIQVEAVAPALFMVSHANATPNALAVQVASDGRQTSLPVFNCSGPVVGGFSCGPAPIRVAGDPIYLSFYGTGFRGANAGNVTASVSGVQLPVEYAGPQGTPGIDQINVRLLPEAVLGPPGFVTLSIDGVPANTALLQLSR
jgi:uncharacterized protein (TIGR03437 family)